MCGKHHSYGHRNEQGIAMNQLREGCKPKANLSRELLVGLAVGGKQQQGGNQEPTGEALLRAGGRGTLWQWLEEVRICCFLN